MIIGQNFSKEEEKFYFKLLDEKFFFKSDNKISLIDIVDFLKENNHNKVIFKKDIDLKKEVKIIKYDRVIEVE